MNSETKLTKCPACGRDSSNPQVCGICGSIIDPEQCLPPHDDSTSDERETKIQRHSHSELREMLANISLPFTDRPANGKDWSNGGRIFSKRTQDGQGIAHIYSVENPEMTADYLVHCANLLPKLLGAVEIFEQSMSDYFQSMEIPPALTEEWNTLSDVIAAAHGGDIRARLTGVSISSSSDEAAKMGNPEQTTKPKSPALQALVDTINATGGLETAEDGIEVPCADTEWADLADAYKLACEELGVEPKVQKAD